VLLVNTVFPATVDPASLRIDITTVVYWGERDPVIPITWADRLSESFSDLPYRALPDIGHFVPFEACELTLEMVQS